MFYENGVETVYDDRGSIGVIKDFITNSRTRFSYGLTGHSEYVARDRNAAADPGDFWKKFITNTKLEKKRTE